MKKIQMILISSLYIMSSCAQSDSAALFREVKEKFSKGSPGVSAILTDKKYEVLHPATEFRELIREHCGTGSLSIAPAGEPGKKIRVLVQVKDRDGKPVPGALVYLYQTDARGWYAAASPHVMMNEGDYRHARLFGYIKTDGNGNFELHTVKPSGYPKSDLPAHIHVHVSREGYLNYVTEFLFDDDTRLVGKIREQSVQNRFLIALPEKPGEGFDQQFSYTVIMEK